MQNWFTVDRVEPDTFVISEYRHWEQTHCYLLNGAKRSLLIDTGLGVCDISAVVRGLTSRPVTALPTHIHWDHIGGLRHYPDFAAHEAELDWLTGGFPQPVEAVRAMVADRCDLPQGFDLSAYTLFQGRPAHVLHGGERLDIGGRTIEVLHTPGHSPGHLCFWEPARGALYTGDLVYKGTLAAWYPSTSPAAYARSLEQVAALPVQRVFPAHHSLDVGPELVRRMRDAFRQLRADGLLHHGSGTFDYGDWSVRL